MTKTLAVALSALLAFGPAATAFAETGHAPAAQQDCKDGKSGCTMNKSSTQMKSGHSDSKAPAKSTKPSSTNAGKHARASAPKVGQSGKSGSHFTPPAKSKLGKAPKGEEYRVVGDYLVLIKTSSMLIAKVVGPASSYR